MANPISPLFPNAAQQVFTPVPDAPLIGDVWEGELFNPGVVSYYIPRVVEVGQTTSITLGANAPGDTLTITIDGVAVTATAGASLVASCAAVELAIETPALLSAIVGATSTSPVVTLAFTDFAAHTVAVLSSGATTIVAALVTPAVANAQLDYGQWVAKRAAIGSMLNIAGQPSATSDLFAGVLFRVPGARPFTDLQALITGQSADWLPVGLDYALAMAGVGIVVPFVGSAPGVLDPVFRVCSGGANYGKWATSDLSVAGTSEGVTLTLVTVAADVVAFDYDGLPPLSIASATGVEITDAADLFAQWVSSAAYAAIGSIVDNLDGTLTVTFVDTTTHVFTDGSGGGSSIAEVVDTAAAAGTPASAVAMPTFSWGRPSISGVTNQPDRAFLRLSPS